MAPIEHAPLRLMPQLSCWLNESTISPDRQLPSLWRLTFPVNPLQFRKQARLCAELSKQLSFENDREISLFLGIMPAIVPNEMDLWVRICSQNSTSFLPSNLKLMILDADREVVMQATTRETHRLQLEFSGEIGEIFGIQLEFQNFKFSEQFQI
ncbi:MAG: DUF1822 family protein [Cyanobacteria bacterium SID2]|nr:DUF1822 family protein [Cyanobacteria bacterium SID2]MBP0002728.1 DUF1822 family protein [Cyanobacteria bacterium SBC]